MKNTFTNLFRSGILALSIIGVLNIKGKAQDGSGELMRLGDDAKAIMGAYLGPLGESFGVNMNSGWYNTGKPLKTGRFELRLSAPMTMPTLASKTYNPQALLSSEWSAPSEAPTIFGDKDAEPGYITRQFSVTEQGQTHTEEVSIQLPPGALPLNPLPPSLQLSVGLIKGTEVMVRFIPTLKYQGASVASWGLGVKHDVKQWIPVVNKLPFDLSVVAAFSSLNVGYEFGSTTLPVPSGTKAIMNYDQGTTSTYSESMYEGQGISFKNTAWNLNLIVSKKLPFVTPYAGLRYGSSNSILGLDGVYGYVSSARYDPNDPQNPFLEITNFEEGELSVEMPFSQVSANVGVRLKLAIFTFFAEGNFGKYNTYTGGVGIGFMN